MNITCFIKIFLFHFRSPERVAREEKEKLLKLKKKEKKEKVKKIRTVKKIKTVKKPYRPKISEKESFAKFSDKIKTERDQILSDSGIPYKKFVAQCRLSHLPANERKGISISKFMYQERDLVQSIVKKLKKDQKFRCGKCNVDVEKVEKYLKTILIIF